MSFDFRAGAHRHGRTKERAAREPAPCWMALIISAVLSAMLAALPGLASAGQELFFSAISAKLAISPGQKPNQDAFFLQAGFALGKQSSGIDPRAEPVTMEVGTFAATIPPSSFKGDEAGPFHFLGLIEGIYLDVVIKPAGPKRYTIEAKVHRADLSAIETPVMIKIAIGNNSGTTFTWEPEIARELPR